MSSSERTALAHQFEDLAQQHEADKLGMWVFLVTELLLFGGIFLAYAIYRFVYPEAWAEGSHHNNIVLGTINTAVLLVSSLTAALAAHAAEAGHRKVSVRFLLATVVLGALFLAIKFYEYYEHYAHGLVPGLHFQVEGPEAPHVALFFVFYFAMTGLHALHMVIGIGLVAVMALLVHRGAISHYMPVEVTALYWHLIDIIWVFLFPLLYLIG